MIRIMGKKVGMTQIFEEDGAVVPVSVVEMMPNTVIYRKTVQKEGYNACVLGYGEKKHPNKPYAGEFKALNIKPTQVLYEVRNAPEDWTVGSQLGVKVFSGTQKVNVSGCSIGKGFAGGMKRYGWKGGPDGHGSKFHRRPGSVGTAEPGETVKGHPLPGRMGNDNQTTANLKLVKIDESKNLLFIRGAIPGAKNSYVLVIPRKNKIIPPKQDVAKAPQSSPARRK
ncbi:MAG: 50S ribosomal protein L3 [bacterium]|nr:50S ribosomal protein L3 [bacterium]